MENWYEVNRKKKNYEELLGGKPEVFDSEKGIENIVGAYEKNYAYVLSYKSGYIIRLLNGKYFIPICNKSHEAYTLRDAEKILWEEWAKYNN